MVWSRKTVLLVVAVALALAAGVWALGDPAPNPGGLGALPAPRDADRPLTIPTPPPDEGLSTPTAAPNEAVWIAPGVTLWPGDDGTLPVTVRWVRRLYGPEAVAVDGESVYAAHVTFDAYDVADGGLRWRAVEPSGEGFDADGGVLIGTQGPGRVRVWAPFDYDLTVDRESGHIERLRAGGEVSPKGFLPLPAPPTTAYRVHPGLRQVVARDRQGAVAWRITVDEPDVDTIGPISVAGGMVVVLSSGDLVALDVPTPS